LDVYKLAFGVAMRIFELTKSVPIEERFSLTDQIRRSSRAVCANLSEGWRKRSYEGAFVLQAERLRGRSSRNSNVAWIRQQMQVSRGQPGKGTPWGIWSDTRKAGENDSAPVTVAA